MSERSDITSIEDLEALYGSANPNSHAKETSFLTIAYRNWIEKAPFFSLASVGEEGLDCSPRGDAAGQLFQIVDDKTLIIPDRRGNNRLDTLRNIIGDPRVALLFLIPGINETLRINGKARLSTDTKLLDQFAVGGKKPLTVIIVQIEAVYFQCARALTRSNLWEGKSQINRTEVPSAGQMTKSVLSEFDAATYDAELFGTPEKNPLLIGQGEQL
ncbi:MAG: pyridoxamine 5'-phosphate oxidase family protein [Sneathiella sp.]|uniref:pyridoxamine 5'-phosphate oxidase family protein n=1 Tax=Sneathiella sp. TaxID=1964365 RepID=UPI003002BA14